MSYVLVGCTYAVLSVITLPLYFRILYIFWSTRKYRKFQSYFLMIQIGVAQCGMAPGHAFAGLAVALQCDFLSLASFFIKVVTGCRRAEALLSLALAYDRFVVMCEVTKIPHLLNVLSALAWIYGFFYFTIVCSPYADLTVIPSTYTSAYDNSFPATLVLQEIGTYTTLAALAFTFVLYLIIVWTLIQHKLELTLVHISFNEKNILLQAVVRFLGDTSMTLLYHIVPQFVGQSDWMSIVTHIGYIVNNITLPPILFLVISKSLRNDVLKVCQRQQHINSSN